MNRDDIKKILGEGVTEEQITNLLNTFHNANNDSKKKLDDLNKKLEALSDYDTIKTELTNIKNANMSEQEKFQADKKQVEENLKQSRIILNTAKAKEILAGLELDEDTVNMVVSDDETATINNANKLKNQFTSMKEAVAKKTKEELATLDQKPSISNVPQGEDKIMTKEKFDKLTFAEQKAWKDENLDKYHEFYPQNK